MAKLMLVGEGPAPIDILLTSDPEDGQTIATCVRHWGIYPRQCSWSERYDTMDDAVEYAADHADRGSEAHA